MASAIKLRFPLRRARLINGQSFLIFPELINLKRPIEEEKPVEEASTYTVSGAVENVFASLVVLLGYTQIFTRTQQWPDNARCEVSGGAVCGFRQETERNGELSLTLCFCGKGPTRRRSRRCSTDAYFRVAFNLILSLYNIPPNHPVVADHVDTLDPDRDRCDLAPKVKRALSREPLRCISPPS